MRVYMNLNPRSIKTALISKSRYVKFIGAVLLVLVIAFFAIHIASNQAANAYTKKVSILKSSIAKMDSPDINNLQRMLANRPKLTNVLFGSTFNKDYKNAQDTQLEFDRYATIANTIKSQSQVKRSDDDFAHKLQALSLQARTDRAAIADATKSKESDAEFKFSKIKDIRVQSYKDLITLQEKEIQSVSKIQTPDSLDDLKTFYLSLLKKNKDILSNSQKSVRNAKSFAVLSQISNTDQYDRQILAAQIVSAVYAVENVPRYSTFNSVALKESIAKNDPKLPLSPISLADLNYYSVYGASAYSKSATKLQLGQFKILGLSSYSLYKLQNLDTSKFTKSESDNYKKRVTKAQDSLQVYMFVDTQLDNPTTAGVDLLEQLPQTSNFTVAANEVDHTPNERAEGTQMDMSQTRAYIKRQLPLVIPKADSVMPEAQQYKDALQKCFDIRFKYYEQSAPFFNRSIEFLKKENELRDKASSVAASDESDSAKQKAASEITQSLDKLKVEFNDMNMVAKAQGETYKTDIANCLVKLKDSQDRLLIKSRDKQAVFDDVYNKFIDVTKI